MKKCDTKNDILEAALNVFSQNNYHTTTMTMIAEEAGVSKGTLYWHFDSKEELFRDLLLSGLDMFSNYFKKTALEDISADKKIYEIIKFGVEVLVKNAKTANILRNNVELISKKFQEKVEEKHDQNIEIFKKIIEQGIKEGSIKDCNPRNTAVMMLAVLFTSHADWLLEEFADIEKQIEFTYDFVMNGIRRKEN
ncbi:MAG: TetR/AcrR family transcriptional regulator [Halanaerobium sp.]